MNERNHILNLSTGYHVFAHSSTTMDERNQGLQCGVFAIIGGIAQLYLNIDVPKGFIQKLGEVAISAGVSTFMGLIVKNIWLVAKRAMIDYFRSFRKPRKY